MIIDGKAVAASIRGEIKEKVAESSQKYGKHFKLVVVIVGQDPASEIYVRNKAKACEDAGIESETLTLEENCSESELCDEINRLAQDESVDGILVQLPLPKNIDAKKVLELIPPEKDVDGFSNVNIGKLTTFDNEALCACTPHGIMKLLDYYGVELKGKRAVVVGRSNIVGKPVALMLLQRDCTVTICHSKTENLADITRTADILVCAVGKKHLITADMVKDGVVVIDAGINRGEDKKIYGDVDFDNVSKKAKLITPVPGGVGPMTITMLLYNTYEAGMRKLYGRK